MERAAFSVIPAKAGIHGSADPVVSATYSSTGSEAIAEESSA